MGKAKSDKTHIIKRDVGWAIKKEGSDRASKVYPTKHEAIKQASKNIKTGAEVIIHKKDGTIQDWKNYKSK